MSPAADSSTPSVTPRIAVVGAGIAGLAASHRLIELSRSRGQTLDVVLLDGATRPGGMIATERRDGFVIEGGADAFLSEKPWALALCQRLGIENELIRTRDEFRRTYVVRAGRLCPLPEGFMLLAPTQLWPLLTSPCFSWRGKLRMGLDLFLPRGTTQDETLASFVRRRLGQEVLERAAQPLVGGIYTADPERLSLAATMPRFLEMERRERSIVRALRAQQRRAAAPVESSGARWSLFLSFRDGMQTLVDRLAQRLPEGVLRLGTAVHSLARAKRGWLLNNTLACDSVILATPAPVAATLLEPIDAGLATELREIPHASSAIVTAAYRREDIPHPLSGFGFVVPQVEQRSLIAGTFSSVKFAGRAPDEFVLVRAFVGGALQPHLYDQDDSALQATVRRELQGLLGIVAPPLFARVTRYPTSMPQYHVGHLDRLVRIDRALACWPRLALAGNAYRGVGIPDCIHSGETAADMMMLAVVSLR